MREPLDTYDAIDLAFKEARGFYARTLDSRDDTIVALLGQVWLSPAGVVLTADLWDFVKGLNVQVTAAKVRAGLDDLVALAESAAGLTETKSDDEFVAKVKAALATPLVAEAVALAINHIPAIAAK